MPSHDYRPGAMDETIDAGAVEAFLPSVPDDDWRPSGRILARQPSRDARLGGALAISDDAQLVAVGAAGQKDVRSPAVGGTDTGETIPGIGAVHVYRYGPSDRSWNPLSFVQAPELDVCITGVGGCDDRFGRSVSLTGDGDTLAVGAPLEDSHPQDSPGVTNKLQDSGIVYIY